MLPYRFTGKELDRETGLYYYGARYLNPKTSRWVSGDPAGWELINPMEKDGKSKEDYLIIESTNWYTYTSNNPIKYFDPAGMEHHDNIILSFVRIRTPEQSIGNPNSNGSDYAWLNTADGLSWIPGFQASATRKTPGGKNDSIKSGSKVMFKLRKSENTLGFSLTIIGGETIDGRKIGDDGIPEGSTLPNTVHGNSPADSSIEYNAGVLESEGCSVGKVKSQTELIGKILKAGVELGDTFTGYINDFKDIEAP